MECSEILSSMKMAYVIPVHKKGVHQLRIAIVLQALWPICQKHLKDACVNKFYHVLITSSQKVNVDL